MTRLVPGDRARAGSGGPGAGSPRPAARPEPDDSQRRRANARNAGPAQLEPAGPGQWFAANDDLPAETALRVVPGGPRHGRPEEMESANGAAPADAGTPEAEVAGPAVATPPEPEAETTQTRQGAGRILGVVPAEPPTTQQEAAAVDGVTVAEPRPAAGEEPQARGHLCPRGHLNDPRSQFCLQCGLRVEERSGALVAGARPPLGLLIFDNGATHTVDADYLVGRMPEADPRVRAGALRSLLIDDSSGAVSRVHAEIHINGWDVLLVDSGSRNGTFVAGPGEQAWTALPARQSRRLVVGTRVRLGGRTFLFESPPGVR
ncbi:MAG: domain containing protein [Pseudonocardia sp.]|nr:domain containing protein [Pseudonocardia sp.]